MDPIIICPYLYDHEKLEIEQKFFLSNINGKHLEFFFWQDKMLIGPELAFEFCWSQFPDRDIIIIHSDMAPLQEDSNNSWFDQLLHFREMLPYAGIIGCNLFYPRPSQLNPIVVQCAGGTFIDGRIGHLHGPVSHKLGSEGIAASTLNQIRKVPWATFGGVLIRRSVIDTCGNFDRRYNWAYVRDVDYCFEARMRGFQVFQVPVSLLHEESRTTRSLMLANSKLGAQAANNLEIFYEKWNCKINLEF